MLECNYLVPLAVTTESNQCCFRQLIQSLLVQEQGLSEEQKLQLM